MFTTSKNETELRNIFGKMTIEELDDTVLLNCRAFAAAAQAIADAKLGDDPALHQLETLSLQLQLQTVRAGIAKMQDMGSWLMLMPGERNLPKEVKAMNVAMEKASATVARLAAKVGVSEERRLSITAVNYPGLKAGACNFKLG